MQAKSQVLSGHHLAQRAVEENWIPWSHKQTPTPLLPFIFIYNYKSNSNIILFTDYKIKETKRIIIENKTRSYTHLNLYQRRQGELKQKTKDIIHKIPNLKKEKSLE